MRVNVKKYVSNFLTASNKTKLGVHKLFKQVRRLLLDV